MNLREHIFGKRFWMVSPLAHSECVERLKKETGSSSLFSNGKPFLGSIQEDSIRIMRNAFLMNSYQTALHAWLLSDNNKTLLDCSCGLNRTTRVVLVFWILLAIPVSGFILFATPDATYTLFGHVYKATLLSRIMFFIAALSMPVAMVTFTHVLGRNEEGRLVEFLETTIGAQRIQSTDDKA